MRENPENQIERLQLKHTTYGTLSEDSSSKVEALQFIQKAKEQGMTSIALVVDIFRATTTIAYLLDCGVKYVVIGGTDPQFTRKIVDMKKVEREGIYFGIGSDASGQAEFELPNSPSIIQSQKDSVKGRIAVMHTSKGTEAILNAVHLGFDRVVPASYPTTNAMMQFLAQEQNKKNCAILIIATEGRFSEDKNITEDALYAEFIGKMLTGKSPDTQEYLELTSKTQGSRRFRKSIPHFPIGDIEAALKQPSSFSFLPIVREIHDVILIRKEEQK